MSWNRIFAALGVIVLGIAAGVAAPAYAGGGFHHHSHAHFGVVVGVPAYWYYPSPYYYYPPYAYYPPYSSYPPAGAPAAAYIERGDARAAPGPDQDSWYYCPETKAYYPYVKQCAGGWQRVAPQPPG